MRAKLEPRLASPRFGTSAELGKPSGLMRVEGDKLDHERHTSPRTNDASVKFFSRDAAASANVIVKADALAPPSAASASLAACALTLMGRRVGSTGGAGAAAGAAGLTPDVFGSFVV